jgi:hypothetical protein
MSVEKKQLGECCWDDSLAVSEYGASTGFQPPIQISHQLSRNTQTNTGFRQVLLEPVFSLPVH